MDRVEYMRGKYEWAVDDVQVVEPAAEASGETASGMMADDKAEETVEDTDRKQ